MRDTPRPGELTTTPRRKRFPDRHTHLRAGVERTTNEESRAFLDKS